MQRLPVPLLAVLVTVVLTGMALTGVAAAQPPEAIRVAGDDSTAFSIALSRQVFADAGADGITALHAVLGRDDVFADSLAAGPLLGGGPLLYVPGGEAGTLPEAVAEELGRLLPPGATVYLAGGTAAVSSDIEEAVDALGFLPVRAGGEDRTETAAAIAGEHVRLAGAPTTVLLARAGDWPDAIAGGSLAASEGLPILLTDGDAASVAAAAFLDAHPDAEVVILGGVAAISDAVAAELGAERRLAGSTRIGTAAAVAPAFGPDVDGATIANGYVEDGWVEGNAAATLLQPLLLIGPGADDLPGEVRQTLRDRTGPLVVVGGTAAVSDATLEAAEAAR